MKAGPSTPRPGARSLNARGFDAEIYTIRTDGTNAHRLTDNTVMDDRPDWGIR
jgi:hypothetical protein